MILGVELNIGIPAPRETLKISKTTTTPYFHTLTNGVETIGLNIYLSDIRRNPTNCTTSSMYKIVFNGVRVWGIYVFHISLSSILIMIYLSDYSLNTSTPST